VGTRCKPLQSVNNHDSHAHGYERSRSPHMISGFWDGLVWLCLDGKLQWATVIWVE
jgi:hypothetical protein